MQAIVTDEDRAIRRREARARRRARALDLQLVKSRRDGSYMLVDPHTNMVVCGYGGIGCEFGMWLDEIEAALDE